MGNEVGIFYANRPALEAPEIISIDGRTLPQDYVRLMRRADGGCGWLSENQFILLWRLREVARLNQLYEAARFVPHLLLIGSNGGGEAYALNQSGCVVSLPFVGLQERLQTIVAANVVGLVESMSFNFDQNHCDETEIVEIQPIKLGGHPTDPSNKARLSRDEHIKYVRFWNDLLTKIGGVETHAV